MPEFLHARRDFGQLVSLVAAEDKASHVESRRAFYDWLTREIGIPGIVAVERDTDFNDEKLRSAGIRLVDPTTLGLLQGLKSGALLEVGFDDRVWSARSQ